MRNFLKRLFGIEKREYEKELKYYRRAIRECGLILKRIEDTATNYQQLNHSISYSGFQKIKDLIIDFKQN